MSIYLDFLYPAPRDERLAFDNQAAAFKWFSRYLTTLGGGFDKDSKFGPIAGIYPDPTTKEVINKFGPLVNPDGTLRADDYARGDRIQRGVEASGLDIWQVRAGYLAAQLAIQHDPKVGCACPDYAGHVVPLLRRFSVEDFHSTYSSAVYRGLGYAVGRYPLAARMYAAKVGDYSLGWDILSSQAQHRCGFTGRAGNPDLEAYLPRLASAFPFSYLVEAAYSDGRPFLIDANY